VALSALALVGNMSGCEADASNPQQIAPVTVGDLVQEVEVTGELKATDSVAIAPPQIPSVWEYKIAFLAEEGSRIDQGAPVVGFDTTKLADTLKNVQADLDKSQQELERRLTDVAMWRENDDLALIEARARQKRTALKVEQPSDLVASLELKKAELDHELANKEVEYAQIRATSSRERENAELSILRNRIARLRDQVEAIKKDIQRMMVKAPRAGVVVYKSDRHGNKKKVGDNAWRGGAVVEVASLDKMYALGQIDEIELSKVSVGQKVMLRLEADLDTEYTGKIRRIDDTVTRDGERKVLRLEVALAQADPVKMRPGMRFRGRIETGRVRSARQIPLDAVLSDERGAKVYKQRAGKLVPVVVKLGGRNDKYVQVLQGLEANDSVVRFVAPEREP
jgi:HlyD family secretion protein